MPLQTILIERGRFTLGQAISWIDARGYAREKVELSKDYFHFRQRDPVPGWHAYSKFIEPGVLFVFQEPAKRGPGQ
jgi:hypothetical protein